MPYRALTHGRVNRSQNAPADAHTNQVKAINSQKGVANSGPIRKNNSNNRQSTTRTLSRNFLMAPNAYGNGRFSPGQGKGFPEATPLPSVGSVNRFARRAIARRAVTKRIGVHGSENCCPDNKKVGTQNLLPNLSFTIQQYNNAGFIWGNALWPVPTGGGGLVVGLAAELSNVQGVYLSNTSALFPNNNWGKSYYTNFNYNFNAGNTNTLELGLTGWPTDILFNNTKYYKLSVGDENDVYFSIDLKGSLLNSFAEGNSVAAPNPGGLLLKLEKDPAYDALNVSDTAASPNHKFEISVYDAITYNTLSVPIDLLTIPNGPNWLNADWSGFFNRDFPSGSININTNKINISLTEI